MKCPNCKTGDLYIYKETTCVYRIPLTKTNAPFKQKSYHKPTGEYDTDKDYLRCTECRSHFLYELNEKGLVDKNSVVEGDWTNFG
ncbi:hypothetical protein AAGS61_01665 [Lysinibacillus sp. KU-BSD001]|uniref:hypothetical protein n=1 Tax=Lysinibacillus sp. KU-BSD001 TaxID=3141328 RepID=UPI0036E1B1A6